MVFLPKTGMLFTFSIEIKKKQPDHNYEKLAGLSCPLIKEYHLGTVPINRQTTTMTTDRVCTRNRALSPWEMSTLCVANLRVGLFAVQRYNYTDHAYIRVQVG